MTGMRRAPDRCSLDACRGPRPRDAIVVAGHIVPFRSLIEGLPVMVYVDTPQDGYANVYVEPLRRGAVRLHDRGVAERPEMLQRVLHPEDRDMLALRSRPSRPAATGSTG